MSDILPTKVLFVCLGNICRSPTAHGVFEHMVAEQGLSDRIEVDSCGTGHWHVGKAPDRRSTAKASKRGYRMDHLRARQFEPADYDRFDYILAMDKQNLADILGHRPSHYAGKLGLFLDYAEGVTHDEVPDPYYGGANGFNHVLDLVEWACEGLLADIVNARPAQ